MLPSSTGVIGWSLPADAILAALPLSVGGAVIALMLVGKSFSMPAVIGFLMLMGIVGKNSILLLIAKGGKSAEMRFIALKLK